MTRFNLKPSTQFKRDLRLAIKQNKDLSKLESIIKLLIEGFSLSSKNKDHSLTGPWIGFRECHITPDWLLIYQIDSEMNQLRLVRLGSHAEIF